MQTFVMRSFMEACAEIEETAAQIYRGLARQAEGYEPLQGLMNKLARDEEDHARQLRVALRVSTRETFEGVHQQDLDVALLKQRADQLLEKVTGGFLGEKELLNTAIALENDFHQIHAAYSLSFKDQTVKRLFMGLARADKEHWADLVEYIHAYLRQQRTGNEIEGV